MKNVVYLFRKKQTWLEKPQSKGGGNQREQGEKWSCLLQEQRPIRQDETGSDKIRQDPTCLKNLDLNKKLNGIIGRLVADYRAIFAIEVEFSRSFEK